MILGFIGLGRMGRNMVLHLLEQGIDVVGFNRTRETTDEFAKETAAFQAAASTSGAFYPVYSIPDLVAKLTVPRVVWVMVPNGAPVDEVITQLSSSGFSRGDVVIDGGNSFYKDAVRREKELAGKGVAFLDCGTSGGIEGARYGACLMIGGDRDKIRDLRWLWDAAAVKGGWNYMGPSGAGHFVKMVHNGIEYGMDQAIGEGFEVLHKGPYKLDLQKVAETWTRGSVTRGWLIELIARAFSTDPNLDRYTGVVGGGQTGRWTIETAKELGVKTPVIEESLKVREVSQTNPSFGTKIVAALRYEYGRHEEGRESK